MDKAEALSQQYSSVFTREKPGAVPDKGNSLYPSMPAIEVTAAGVEKLLRDLNPKKAIGPDLIPTRILKENAEEIAPILRVIFQQSLDTGIIPNDWRRANVTAIFKKGSRSDPANYRPVSLTSVSCKVLEHIIFKSIMDHCDSLSILKHYQHGFRSKHSCDTQLLQTCEQLHRELDQKNQTDCLILDFSKAFDTVAHRRLISKLHHYGIRGDVKNWIKNWLVRTQTVVVDGESSKEEAVVSGVPQGTVLGPLLFLLFINDIGEGINKDTEIKLFADDCLIFRTIKGANDIRLLQADLDALTEWAEKWQMAFNAKKCTVLKIHRKRAPLRGNPYHMMGTALDEVDQATYLGLELTNNLSWSPQVQKITKKANNTLHFLRRNLWGSPQKVKEMAYTSMVRPILEYGSTVWDPHEATHINQIEMIQRRAARFVSGNFSRQASVTAILQNLGWHTLQERRCIARLSMFHKIIHQNTATTLPPYILQQNTALRGQHSLGLNLIRANTDPYLYSFFPRTVRCWNILPPHMVYLDTSQEIKAELGGGITSGEILVTNPRNCYARPRLGSCPTKGQLLILF